MALLKEDGSLDIERINALPIEEYMQEMGTLTQEQVEEYFSRITINESLNCPHYAVVDYTLDEDIERNGIVNAEDVINNIGKKN